MTQSEIAREVGVSQPLVCKIITNSRLQKKVIFKLSPVIRLTLDPARVAANGFQGYNQFTASREKVVTLSPNDPPHQGSGAGSRKDPRENGRRLGGKSETAAHKIPSGGASTPTRRAG